jgi:hypothetical protein
MDSGSRVSSKYAMRCFVISSPRHEIEETDLIPLLKWNHLLIKGCPCEYAVIDHDHQPRKDHMFSSFKEKGIDLIPVFP